MKTVTPAMAAHLAGETATLATCWTITRTDGVVFRYTTHDQDVTFLKEVYRSAAGFERSAMKSSASFAVDEMEVMGLLRDDGITDEEMRNGAFDYAQVEVFLVNYEDSSMGRVMLRTGYFAEVQTNDAGLFTVELRGLVDMLQNKIGNTYLPECRVDLGSASCGVKLKPDVYERGRRYKTGERMIYPVLLPDGDTAEYFNDLISAQHGWSGSKMGEDTQMTPRVGPLTLWTANWSSVDRYIYPNELGLTPEEIAADNLKIVLTGWYYFYWQNSAGYVTMACQQEYFNTGFYTDISGFKPRVECPNERPERIWRKFSIEMDISKATKRFRFQIGTPNMGHTAGVCWDDLTLAVVPRNQPTTNFATYGGIEFVALNDGKTSTAPKAFPMQIGDELVDGDVTWRVVEPTWTFLRTVTALSSSTTQIAAAPVTNPAPSYFEAGVLTWLSGKNAGRACEISSYDGTTGLIKVALPFPYQPQIGDIFSIQVGCNKDHKTCRDNYKNIINFRGHPRVPGNGLYFKVAGM